MNALHEKIERHLIKLSLGLLIALVLFVALCWGGWRAYTGWQQRHLVRRAVGFMSGGNLKEAALCVRRVWQIRPTADAARIMAQISERTGDRAAIDWRRKVLQLAPTSEKDALALAATAGQFNDSTTAEYALGLLGERERDTAVFHATAGKVASMKHQLQDAARHWERAVQLRPDDNSYKLQLALAQLRLPEPARRAAGHTLLEDLRKDPTQRAEATRALIGYAVANRENVASIYALARELQTYPERILADRLRYLDVLRQTDDPEFASYLTSVESEVASKPIELAKLISWMNATGQAAIALHFAGTLPPQQVSRWPVPLPLAESYAGLGDWAGLERLVKNADWHRLDFMRRAFLARAYRANQKDGAAESEWAAATKQAAADPETLSLLTRTVSQWDWKNEVVELLWTLTKFPEKQHDALQALYVHYHAERDSQGLYRVLLRLAETDSADLDVQNNLAQISLLLNAEPNLARKTAEQAYRKNPRNSFYATTFAYSLYSKGDVGGALKVMGNLSENELREPAISAYYVIFLAATGNVDGARQFVPQAEKAHLLPEESALFERAKRHLQLKAVSSRMR